MKVQSGQPEALKRHNRQLLMRLVADSAGVSRATLARQANLSRTTVSNIVAELLEQKLVCEVGDSYTGGRPATLLQIDNKGWYALGAELHDDSWNLVLLDMVGKVAKSMDVKCEGTPRQIISQLATGVHKMCSRANHSVLPGIGLSVPGLVDMDAGVITRRIDNPTWVNIPVQEWAEAELRMPVRVINRHKASGWAEARYGAGAGLADLLYVGVGSGISGAVYTKGAILFGTSFSSGEVGHITVLPDGPLCNCGNRGCLQAMASGQAIVKRVAEMVATGEMLTVEEVFMAAQNGDQVAITAIEEAGRYIGIVVAGLINTLNPAIVVLGGSIGRIEGPLLPAIQAEVRQRALANAYSASRIVTGTLGRQAGAIGAANLIMENRLELVFDQPGKGVLNQIIAKADTSSSVVTE